MTQEQVNELNEVFAELNATVKTKKIRKLLERINRVANTVSGGVVTFVNWNS